MAMDILQNRETTASLACHLSRVNTYEHIKRFLYKNKKAELCTTLKVQILSIN